MKDLCIKAKEILMEEANVQYVDSPVTVSAIGSLSLLPGTYQYPGDGPLLRADMR